MIIVYYIWLFVAVFIPCKKTVLGDSTTSFQESGDCECGKGNEFVSRIVGGRATLPNEFPWMVGIFNKNRMHCGGSLINDRYILTAGHCLSGFKKENLSVILGMHDRIQLETEKLGGVPMEIEETLLHENFKSLDMHDIYDIGLIKLKESVTFNEKISSVCLPKGTDETYAGKVAQVTGWGRISQGGEVARYLKEASVKVMTKEECKEVPKMGEHILDSMLCGYEDEVDACQGDSGGPMTFETESGTVEQIGLVSFGYGCAIPGMPGVYTRITSYLPWIASNTKDGIYCKRRV